MFKIADRHVREALETVTHEFAAMEQHAEDLHKQVVALDEENEELHQKVDELQNRIAELEEALVEAHLTGDDDGKRTDEDSGQVSVRPVPDESNPGRN